MNSFVSIYGDAIQIVGGQVFSEACSRTPSVDPSVIYVSLTTKLRCSFHLYRSHTALQEFVDTLYCDAGLDRSHSSMEIAGE